MVKHSDPKNFRLYDAYNHLQDERLVPHHDAIMTAAEQARIVKMVVNSSCEADWPPVLELARQYLHVIPSFGYHPWIRALAELGAYFSLPGYFAHERKARQRETFRQVPLDRLLLETDAPDQLLPDERNRFPLIDAKTGQAINHPANLVAVYRFASELMGEPVAALAERIEDNFLRLFGRVTSGSDRVPGAGT